MEEMPEELKATIVLAIVREEDQAEMAPPAWALLPASVTLRIEEEVGLLKYIPPPAKALQPVIVAFAMCCNEELR
jgi:hypothetical protein